MADINFDEVKERATEMVADRQLTIQMFDRMEDIFLLEATGLPDHDWIKATVSPDARNKLLGAIRLLTATDPKWSIPYDRNDASLKDKYSSLERFAARVFSASGRITKKPIHFDAVLSALLYGEVHISIVSTKQLQESTKSVRAENATKFTPTLFSILPPRCGYPEYDELGLCGYLYRQEMTVGKVLGKFGKDAEKMFGDKSRYEKVYLLEYYDDVNRYVWTEGSDQTILEGKHEYPTIPIVVNKVEGSDMFIRSGQMTTQPFLYTLDKSQIHQRQSELMTVMYSLLFAMGLSPNFVYTKRDEERPTPSVNLDEPYNVIDILSGESFESLQSQLYKPEIMNALTMAGEKISESTIYSQALGEPLGGNAPYSMVALLHQAGRLPLVPYQRTASWALGDAMQIAFKMIKQDGGTQSVGGDSSVITLKAADIPDVFEIECLLEIDMPTDDRQNAQIVNELTDGDNPKVSLRWALEKILNIGQPDDMMKEIYDEKATIATYQMRLAQAQAALQAKLQQQMQAQQQPQQLPQGQPMSAQPQQQQQGQPSPQPTQADLQAMAQMQQQQGGDNQMGEQMPGAELQQPLSPAPPLGG